MVYLIHFKTPYVTATGRKVQHYIGFTSLTIEQRLKRHKSDSGAKLLKAVNEAGISYDVVFVWKDAGIEFEYKLKRSKNHKRFCPICKMKQK